MIDRGRGRGRRRLRLPVVRVRALPGDRARWEEGPDWPAVIAVATVGGVGAALSVATLIGELAAEAPQAPVIAGAVLLAVACVAASLLAVAEAMHRERIEVHGNALEVIERGLAGSAHWREPLDAYEGLMVVDRQRRLFVRNQDRPPTGRRGPVTEFVVVLRHRADPGRDLELFRAQPSLETLRAMHALNAARSERGGGGGIGAEAAAACEDRARGYRDAVCELARALDVRVLVVTGDGASLRAVEAERLGTWLEPDGRDGEGDLPA